MYKSTNETIYKLINDIQLKIITFRTIISYKRSYVTDFANRINDPYPAISTYWRVYIQNSLGRQLSIKLHDSMKWLFKEYNDDTKYSRNVNTKYNKNTAHGNSMNSNIDKYLSDVLKMERKNLQKSVDEMYEKYKLHTNSPFKQVNKMIIYQISNTLYDRHDKIHAKINSIFNTQNHNRGIIGKNYIIRRKWIEETDKIVGSRINDKITEQNNSQIIEQKCIGEVVNRLYDKCNNLLDFHCHKSVFSVSKPSISYYLYTIYSIITLVDSISNSYNILNNSDGAKLNVESNDDNVRNEINRNKRNRNKRNRNKRNDVGLLMDKFWTLIDEINAGSKLNSTHGSQIVKKKLFESDVDNNLLISYFPFVLIKIILSYDTIHSDKVFIKRVIDDNKLKFDTSKLILDGKK